jgi:hypothetical protein
MPFSERVLKTSEVLRVEPIPITVGVPAVPKETGVVFAISATITDASAGKPNDRSNGATRATGTPNPAAPSIKPPNNHAIMIVCTLLSDEIVENPWLMIPKAPLSLRVKSKVKAPNTISIIFNIITRPLRPDATTQFNGVFHTKSTKTRVTAKATGIAFVAGQRKLTINIKIVASGITASSARIPSVMRFYSKEVNNYLKYLSKEDICDKS